MPIAELSPIERAISSTVEAGRQLDRGLVPLELALEQDDSSQDDAYSLVGQLRIAAALIASDEVAPRVIYVHGTGDFDTHDDQRSTHDELMTQFDRGVAEFFAAIDRAGKGDKAVVMTTSEFGRRAEENGTGTDHGTASSHFLIGRTLAGGRYGETASLSKLDIEGNLRHTVDFRSMFATVLDGWLGANHPEVLRRAYETLPVF